MRCCQAMDAAVSIRCDDHPDRFQCPDALLVHIPEQDVYGIIIHDGGRSFRAIAWCPFCGASLESPKR